LWEVYRTRGLCKSKKLFPELHGSFFENKKTEKDLSGTQSLFQNQQRKVVSRTAREGSVKTQPKNNRNPKFISKSTTTYTPCRVAVVGCM
jgi:hypothetical protein